MDNLEFWTKMKTPPEDALKKISGGRLSGKSDINPVWRMEVMTEVFGPCGLGWKYSSPKYWKESGVDGEVILFCETSVSVRYGEVWGEPIPGIGGSMLIAKESKGLYANDEACKMALTDALSVGFKALGVAADVYRGRWDGSKFAADKDAGKKSEDLKKDIPSTSPSTRKDQKGDRRDASGRLRWLGDMKCFDDDYQTQNSLITTEQWKSLVRGIQALLAGDLAFFAKWLRDNHKVEFYDITQPMLAEIVKKLQSGEVKRA